MMLILPSTRPHPTHTRPPLQEQKAARRLQRGGAAQQIDPDFGRKPCDLCALPKDTLIRCQVDASGAWRMVRPRGAWRGRERGVEGMGLLTSHQQSAHSVCVFSSASSSAPCICCWTPRFPPRRLSCPPTHPAQVCGRCWQGVSGGVVDGDAAHPHYRYGGLWRNLHKPK
jgi:hypothetical protein